MLAAVAAASTLAKAVLFSPVTKCLYRHSARLSLLFDHLSQAHDSSRLFDHTAAAAVAAVPNWNSLLLSFFASLTFHC